MQKQHHKTTFADMLPSCPKTKLIIITNNTGINTQGIGPQFRGKWGFNLIVFLCYIAILRIYIAYLLYSLNTFNV